MSVYVFTDASDAEQVSDIFNFYQENGRCVDNEMNSESWHDTLKLIIENVDLIFDDKIQDSDMVGTINSIVSLILLMPGEVQVDFAHLFCRAVEKKFSNNDKKERMKYSALNMLFNGITSNELKVDVYESLLNEEINSDKKHRVNVNLKDMEILLKEWDCSHEQNQRILRKLHQIFLIRGDKHRAAEAMMMLLRSFSDDKAPMARDDAIQCIIDALLDPNALTMDQILALKPVQCLKGEPIYELLSIFVTGTIVDYQQFVKQYPDFMDKYQLDEEACLTKIRILSLMQLAAGDTTELAYDTIQNELQLNRDELEAFVIEAVRQQAVSCKLDQQQEKVLIAGAVPRSFSYDQWVKLCHDLEMWEQNFKLVIDKLSKMGSE